MNEVHNLKCSDRLGRGFAEQIACRYVLTKGGNKDAGR